VLRLRPINLYLSIGTRRKYVPVGSLRLRGPSHPWPQTVPIEKYKPLRLPSLNRVGKHFVNLLSSLGGSTERTRGISRTVCSHGWLQRAPMDGFTACPGDTSRTIWAKFVDPNHL